MKSLILSALLLLFAARIDAAEGTKPNIIVILTDDQGWADLGAQTVRQDIRTPNLDALAAGGLRATNGYVSAPQCVPSRAGLITGRHQQRFGVESNLSKLDGFDQQQTIAARLKKAGYATGMTGKWHLGPQEKIDEHGFDDVFCTQSSSGMNLRAWANFDLEGRTTPLAAVNRNDLYHLEANASAACAFIQRHAREPFFFYLAYRAPHVPLDAPQKYVARFPGEMPERRRMALASMSAIDDGVGRVMQTLREHGLEEKTLVFFMSDNGAPLMMTMRDLKPVTENGWDGSINLPMNGEKGMLTEGGMREPWLAYWKGTIPAGQAYAQPVISLDIAATAVALAGLPADPQLDGVNLMPFFTGQNQAAPHDTLHWRWIDQSAIREGRWKLLIGGPRSYLFDLDADPEEKHNLIAQHADIGQRLRAKLETWSSELQPPGIHSQSMAKIWEDSYDYFLDGKPAVEDKGLGAGWIARNGTTTMKDGMLHITPDVKGMQRPFLAFANLKIPGPATATASVRSVKGGQVGVAWRLDGQKDFPPEQVTHGDLAASSEFQPITIPVPANGAIIHLRLILPPGESDLRRFEIRAQGSSAAKQWTFEAEQPHE